MSGPMEGVRIVELAVWVAGPATSGILADWGADVVKIEAPPAGDPYRAFYSAAAGMPLPINPLFELDNRGKRTIVVDLRRPEGQRDRAARDRRRRRLHHQHASRRARTRRARPCHAAGALPALVYALATGLRRHRCRA